MVDCPADDMTREGIQIESDMPPDQMDELTEYWTNFEIWHRLNLTLKWARLFGGAVAAIMIDGQDPATPLRLDSIRKGQFQGLIVLDRWMLTPSSDLVRQPGNDFGRPLMYQVVADSRAMPHMRLHHSRVIRFDGGDLPYWQRMSENEWSLSVIEPMWDRMVAFDSATAGAAQLIYKAHLRVLKLPQYREMIATGGPILGAVHQMIGMIRLMQSNEGLTVIDATDEFEVNQYSFGGLADMMGQFAQQVSGAADVPMTRMFGQSPAGMNSTGESDLRNYYDGIRSQQEFRLRPKVKLLLDITHRSLRGVPLPNGFNFSFKPLWQLQEAEKAGIAGQTAQSVVALLEAGVFTPVIAMKEIRQSSHITGLGSNITDEDIAAAAAPPMPEMGAEGMGGMAGMPGAPEPREMPPEAAQGEGENPGSMEPPHHLRLAYKAGEDEIEGGEPAAAPPPGGPQPEASTEVHLDPGVTARINLPENTVVNLDKDDVRWR